MRITANINPDITIITTDIKHNPLDVEEFKHHRAQLERLQIIKKNLQVDINVLPL